MFELQSCPTTLYIVGDKARDRCAELLVHQSAACGPVEELTARLLAAVWLPKVAPCETERIAENAVRKLDEIASRKFKWVSQIDIRCMARNLLSPACDDGFLWQDNEWDIIPF